MTVAFDVSYIQRQRAGYGRFSLELLRGLLNADANREYLLHGWSYSLDEPVLRTLAAPNVKFSIARIPGPVKRFYWNTLRFPVLENIIGSFDLFHSAEPLLPPIGGRKSIVTLHDLSYRKYPAMFTRSVRQWDVHVIRSLKNADAIIAPSENTRNDLGELLQIPEEKVHVVHPPVSSTFTMEGNPEGDRAVKTKFEIPGEYILFVGTIEPRKNIPVLVEAFEHFRSASASTASLVIVGKPGWLYKEIFAAIERSPMRKHIHVLNYLHEDELASLYRGAQMFVYPSIYEGFGLPVVEAMASGTPVITSNSSSLQEIGAGAALLVDPGNSVEISNAMQTLASSEKTRRELSLKGAERAAEFAVTNAVSRVLRLYNILERG